MLLGRINEPSLPLYNINHEFFSRMLTYLIRGIQFLHHLIILPLRLANILQESIYLFGLVSI
jgi:hypothetical protein